MQAAIDKVSRHIHQQGPIYRIGADQRDIVSTQQGSECRVAKALVPDFHGVPHWPDNAIAIVGRCAQAAVMRLGQARRFLGVAG